MSVVIRIAALAGAITTVPEAQGPAQSMMYLKSYDPEAHEGRGDLVATPHIHEAQRFADAETAHAFWRQQPKARPLREDGEPNRPACAFTIQIIEAPT